MAKQTVTCRARCNLHRTAATPAGTQFPGHIDGIGSGPDQNKACRNAKRDAVNRRPPTSHARHCKCPKCSKQKKDVTREFEELMQEWREELERFGVQSAQDLVQRLPQLRGRSLVTAIELLGKAGDRRAVPALVSLLSSDDPAVRSVAAPSLAMLGGRRALNAAVRIALSDATEQARAAAVSALAFMFDDEAFEPLLTVLTETDELPTTRAAAAEGLGNLLQHADPESMRFRLARSVLIACLRDPSPEVRFWSAFALGCMKAEEALPHLRRLAASDRSTCPGWWAVADEARDAIQLILGEEPTERIPQRDAQ
jgi:hypothetical protein